MLKKKKKITTQVNYNTKWQDVYVRIVIMSNELFCPCSVNNMTKFTVNIFMTFFLSKRLFCHSCVLLFFFFFNEYYLVMVFIFDMNGRKNEKNTPHYTHTNSNLT